MIRALRRAALLLSAATSLAAQQPPIRPVAVDPIHQAGANVTISLLTMGTGPEIWELFGHDALWIHDNVTGRDTVYNWGEFDFSQPRFLQRFLEGRMLYASGGDPLDSQLATYRRRNRYMVSQELDLTPAQRDSILRQIQWYARPENVNYRYDYYRDNCTTKVRDILDNALGGQVRAKAETLTGATYRSESLRLMQVNPPIALGVDIGLGRSADRDLTAWQEMFLPKRLHDFIATLQVRDSAGGLHPLVKRETSLLGTTRSPEPDTSPGLVLWLTATGVVLAGLFAWIGATAMEGGGGARFAAAAIIGLWSIIAGLLGVVLTLLWAVTDHVFAHANENLLLFNPLWLVLAVLAIAALARGRSGAAFRRWSLWLAGLTVLALVTHLVFLSAQSNLAVIGLALPPALAIAWVARRG